MLFPVLCIVPQDLVLILLPTRADYGEFVDHEEDLEDAAGEHKYSKGFVLDRQAAVGCVLVLHLTLSLLVTCPWMLSG